MMIPYMKRIVGVAALCSCVLGIGCGGGSQATQTTTPNQPPGTVTVATGSHVLGDATSKVTIIEFSDIQCPYCKSFHTDTEPQIVQTYVSTGKARFAFRHFPLSTIHQNAEIAAEAAECAAKLGGNDTFWNYLDMLFTNGQGNGTGLDAASLKQYAADLHLDSASFNTCLDNHETAAIVSKDSADGRAAGVSGTPTFFINGKILVGAQTFSTFKALIDAEL